MLPHVEREREREGGEGRERLRETTKWLVQAGAPAGEERDLCIDNLLVRTHFIIETISWTGLAPWEFEFPFPGALYLPSEYAGERERICIELMTSDRKHKASRQGLK